MGESPFGGAASFVKSLDLLKTSSNSAIICLLPSAFCLKTAHLFHESDRIAIAAFCPLPSIHFYYGYSTGLDIREIVGND
ncbi:hypothetical protein [Moorena sp. SIO4G3]|uniref:hypothetical protein n=1 Tax=Moorena sp. SIO4G3 TaxID=2607821 RepID=UPI001428EA44|nr:hypothetical protein [Moorena sp. SIO4G3]NEO81115.1 hypothetical protein [Moorena sp. SIO4G3]